jgi:mRNA interferase RelE/StbE
VAGWATQVFSREFDSMLQRLPGGVRATVLEKITEMGRRLESFPHYRMTGHDEFRLRVGDYRVIYDFDLEKGEIRFITLGHRREVYRKRRRTWPRIAIFLQAKVIWLSGVRS